ncbi:MAG TPA: DUF2600 family protein, partial [Solirubrobacteraceae bacterium]|nr:DUF2600 family protein [Solirubrobacteraceae bacterium]
DFLDELHERDASSENGAQLYSALAEALDPDTPVSAYYRHHVCGEDGGYLSTLVEACRRECSRLPAYAEVRATVRAEARRARVLAINHEIEPTARDTALQRWANSECVGHPDASWFELSGAASATLTIYALLALAAEAAVGEHEVFAVHAVYFPWVSATCTMLDSYVDQDEDRQLGNHCYVDHYPSGEVAVRRIGELIDRSALETRRLPNGHRHAIIAACVVAMYLTRDSALIPAMRMKTGRLVRDGGPLATLLFPILRAWRVAYSLPSA